MAAAGGTGLCGPSGCSNPWRAVLLPDPPTVPTCQTVARQTSATLARRTEIGCVALQLLEYQAGLYNY